jgi:hypothetical protein
VDAPKIVTVDDYEPLARERSVDICTHAGADEWTSPRTGVPSAL